MKTAPSEIATSRPRRIAPSIKPTSSACTGGGECLGRLEEDEVGRRVVEEAGEQARRPEEVLRRVQPQRRTARLEDLDRHLHRQEDPEEQAADLDDRRVAELGVLAEP